MSQAFEVIQPQSTSSTTLIEFILDETGSMSGARKATIDSFNEYINSQCKQPGDCYMTLTKFDQRSSGGKLQACAIGGMMRGVNLKTTVMPENTVVDLSADVRTLYTDVPVDKVQYLTEDTYQPSGMTNLYDAIGVRIHALANRAEQYPDSAKLIVIMTDGQDNVSREYTSSSLKTLIAEKEKLGWTFVFLGANQDAWQVGQTFGMSKGNTMSYSTGDMANAMGTLSAATTAYRGMVAGGALNSETSFKGFFDQQDENKNAK